MHLGTKVLSRGNSEWAGNDKNRRSTARKNSIFAISRDVVVVVVFSVFAVVVVIVVIIIIVYLNDAVPTLLHVSAWISSDVLRFLPHSFHDADSNPDKLLSSSPKHLVAATDEHL